MFPMVKVYGNAGRGSHVESIGIPLREAGGTGHATCSRQKEGLLFISLPA